MFDATRRTLLFLVRLHAWCFGAASGACTPSAASGAYTPGAASGAYTLGAVFCALLATSLSPT
ncbi:MAG: hypothetical protein FWG00_02340 [Coriobacteriia bacterium]|nr:hypothetical protein [Coriobacteriia bacterium]